MARRESGSTEDFLLSRKSEKSESNPKLEANYCEEQIDDWIEYLKGKWTVEDIPKTDLKTVAQSLQHSLSSEKHNAEDTKEMIPFTRSIEKSSSSLFRTSRRKIIDNGENLRERAMSFTDETASHFQPKEMSIFQKLNEIIGHCQYAAQRNKLFVNQSRHLEDAINTIYKSEEILHASSSSSLGVSLNIVGESGYGKTSLLAKLAKECYNKDKQLSTILQSPRPILIRFIGLSLESSNGLGLLKSLCAQLSFIYKDSKAIRHDDINTYEDTLKHFSYLMKTHPVILFLDGIDKLSDYHQERSCLSFLQNIEFHPHTRIIISMRSTDILRQSIRFGFERQVIQLKLSVVSPASEDAIIPTFQTFLSNSNFLPSNLEITKVMECYSSKLQEDSSLLYVKILAYCLYLREGRDAADSNALLPFTIDELINQTLETLELQSRYFRLALSIMTFTVAGVSISELNDLLHLASATPTATSTAAQVPGTESVHDFLDIWKRFLHESHDIVHETVEGTFQWANHKTVSIALKRYEQDKPLIHHLLAKYYGDLAKQQQEGDSSCTWIGILKVYPRQCVEASHHLIEAGLYIEAVEELCKLEAVCGYFKIGLGWIAFDRMVKLRIKIQSKLEEIFTEHSLDGDDAQSQDQSRIKEKSKAYNVNSLKYSLQRLNQYLLWLQRNIDMILRDPNLGLTLSCSLTEPITSLPRADLSRMLASNKHHRMSWSEITNNNIDETWISGIALGNISIVNNYGHPISEGLLFERIGHRSMICNLSFNKDGDYFASGSFDKDIRVWHTFSGQELNLLTGHTEAVLALLFHPTENHILASSSKDKNIIFWQILKGEILFTISQHSGEVYCLAFDRLGKKLASSSSDKSLRIWNIQIDTALNEYQYSSNDLAGYHGLAGGVTCLEFSYDDESIAYGAFDTTAGVWDIKKRQPRCVYHGHLDSVHGLCYVRNGRVIASISREPHIRVWSASTGEEVCCLDGQGTHFQTISFHPSGNILFSAGYDLSIKLWDLESIMSDSNNGSRKVPRGDTSALPVNYLLYSIENAHYGFIPALACSPEGDFLATGSEDLTIKLWHIPALIFALQDDLDMNNPSYHSSNYRSHPENRHHTSRSSSGFYFKDLSALLELRSRLCMPIITRPNDITGDEDTGSRYSFPDGESRDSREGSFHGGLNQRERLSSLSFHSLSLTDAHSVTNSSITGSTPVPLITTTKGQKLIETHDPITTKNPTTQIIGMSGLSFSPDGELLASLSYESKLHVWDVLTGMEIKTTFELEGNLPYITALAFSPNGELIAYGCIDGRIILWDVMRGCAGDELEVSHNGMVTALEFSLDGLRLVSGSLHQIKVLNVLTGVEIVSIQNDVEFTFSAKFSPNGKQIICGSRTGAFVVRSARTGSVVRKFRGHQDQIYCAVFHPFGRLIASASEDKTIRVWDMRTSKELRVLKEHTEAVISLAFSTDGTRLVSGSKDFTVKIWIVFTGKLLISLQAHATSISCVLFSPDGRHVAARSEDGEVRLWFLINARKERTYALVGEP